MAEVEERMVVSKGTARVHLRHVYAKLGVHSREELAGLVRETGEGCHAKENIEA